MTFTQTIKNYYKQSDAVQKIIFWNVLLFIIVSLLKVFEYFVSKNFDIVSWVALPSGLWSFLQKPYTLLSYMFFHKDFLHLLFNLIWLYFSSQLFRTFFTENKLLWVYFLGGIFSGIFYIFLHTVIPVLAGQNNWLMGASGAVLAVFFATVTYNPLMDVRLALIGTVKLWHIALVVLVLDIIQIPSANTGGHLAHLGGVLFGFMYIKLLKKGIDCSKPFQYLYTKIGYVWLPKPKKPFKKIYKNPNQSPANISKNTNIDKKQQILNDILDKISKSGYESLTQNEKDFLYTFGN